MRPELAKRIKTHYQDKHEKQEQDDDDKIIGARAGRTCRRARHSRPVASALLALGRPEPLTLCRSNTHAGALPRAMKAELLSDMYYATLSSCPLFRI